MVVKKHTNKCQCIRTYSQKNRGSSGARCAFLYEDQHACIHAENWAEIHAYKNLILWNVHTCCKCAWNVHAMYEHIYIYIYIYIWLRCTSCTHTDAIKHMRHITHFHVFTASRLAVYMHPVCTFREVHVILVQNYSVLLLRFSVYIHIRFI